MIRRLSHIQTELRSAILCAGRVVPLAIVLAGNPAPAASLDEKQDPVPASADTPQNADQPDTWNSLLDGEIDKRWKSVHSDNMVPLSDVWKIVRETPDAEPLLICVGKPKGFLMTLDQYADFEMSLEWKIPSDQNGNSGVLVYTQDEPRIWPTAIQVQFHQPKAGSIFPSGDGKSDNTSESDLARPVGTWNECRIVSQMGRLSVEINGKKAGEITGAVPANGHIALQSEGAEVHFRRVRIRKLTNKPPVADSSVPQETQ